MVKRCLVISLLIFVMAAPLTAQIIDNSQAPVRLDNIDPLPSERPILEYTLGGAFLLCALALAFMNSKRTHLD